MQSHSRMMLTCVAVTLPFASSYAVAAPVSSAAVSVAGRSTAVRAVADLIKPLAGNGKAPLGGNLPECPKTYWQGSAEIDIDEWQAKYKAEDMPVCPIEVHADAAANAQGKQYFIDRRQEFSETLAKHGTIWFRGFDLMKDTDGFREFWESLDLDPCLDPIHSSGLRKFLSKKDGVYEEVNKQSLSRHYIGLHNEATENKAATVGAFVCFQPATITGGEFFIADGEKIFRDLDADVLKMLYERQVRISVSNLDLGILDNLPKGEGLVSKQAAMDAVREAVADKVAPKFDMDLDMIWGNDGNEMRLQAIEHAQSPINVHPVSKRPIWFCNMHNHARFLRERRYCSVPEVGMTDVYYGNLDIIPGEVLSHVNEVCDKNIVKVPMQKGDVLLCDNYRVLHGRDVFEGDRLHAVSWFGDGTTQKAEGIGASEGWNGVINKLIGD